MRKSRKSTSPEYIIEHNILVALNVSRVGFFWKNISAGYFDGKQYRKHASPFAINGVPDILGIVQGKFIGFEVKSASGKLRDEQKAFMRKALSVGAKVAVVRSPQEALAILKSWGLYCVEQPCETSTY